MQTYEIPGQDQDLHIMIKRPAVSKDDPDKYVAKETFVQFSNMVNGQFQKVLSKMSTLETLLQTLVDSQRQQVQEFEIVEERFHHEPAAEQYETDRDVIEALDDEMELQIEDSGAEETVYIQQPQSPHPRAHGSRAGSSKKKYQGFQTDVLPAKRIKREPTISTHEIEEVIHGEYTEIEGSETIETVETVEAVDEQTGEVLKTMFETNQDSSVLSDVKNKFYDIPLPAPTVLHLKELSSRLELDPNALAKFKQFMQELNTRSEGNFQKALSMMIADPVLFELNWLGFKGKYKMADMFLFRKLLFEEWFPGMDYDDYITQVKLVIKKAHKRYAKNQERRRARESQVGLKKEDPLKEAVKAITIE